MTRNRSMYYAILETVLTNAIAAPVNAQQISEARIKELAALPRAAYAATKRALREGVTSFSDADYAAAMKATLPAWTGDEIKQRVLARLKK